MVTVKMCRFYGNVLSLSSIYSIAAVIVVNG